MKITLSVVALACSVCALAVAQTPTFEVASIKPAAPMQNGMMRVMMSADAGRVTYTNVSLRNILARAFKVKDHQLSGPDWMTTARFDVSAKIPEGVSKDLVPEMLQALLVERFHLTFHRETKVAPVYALIPGKDGIKLSKADMTADKAPGPGGIPAGGMRMMVTDKGRKMTGNVTMAGLADMLSNSLDRPVLDMTNSKETYAMELEWTPDETENMGRMGMPAMRALRPEGAGAVPPPDAPKGDAPNIFGAIQNIGLKLDARKAPLAMIVIDSVDKTPTEN